MLRRVVPIVCALGFGAAVLRADEAALQQLNSIGVYTVIKKGDAIAPAD